MITYVSALGNKHNGQNVYRNTIISEKSNSVKKSYCAELVIVI